jgi:photosystem II stability/assembly factor-like uncharacterized protein
MKKLVLACALLMWAVAAGAGVNSWTPAGPSGAPVRRLAVSSQNRAIVFAATENGLYRSSDAGATWTLLRASFIFEFALDPTNDEVLYILTREGVVARSTNGGASWTNIRTEHVDALEVGHDGTVWAAFGESGLMRSSDRGATWQRPASLPSSITDFASSPGALYVAAGRLFKTTNNGSNWTTVLDDNFLEAVDAAGAVVYAGGNAGVFRSTNAGQSWTRLSGLPGGESLVDLAIDQENSNRVLAVYLNQMWITENAGATWRELTELRGANAFSGAFASGAIVADGQSGIARSADGVHFARANAGIGGDEARFVEFIGSRLFIGTPNSGLHVSDDRGATWQAVGPNVYSSSLAVDPTNPSNVYLGTGGAGVFKSTDGGNTFAPSGLSETINSVAAYGPTVFATHTENVHRSTDGGATWHVAYRSRFFSNTRHVAIDPNAPNIVYATTVPIAVSLDGGTTWSETNLTDNFIRALVIVRGNPSQVFVGGPSIYRATSGTTTFVRRSTGIPANSTILDLSWNAVTGALYAVVAPPNAAPTLYTSTDKGETWKPYMIPPPASVVTIERVAANGNTLWIATLRGLYELTEVHQPRRRAVKK